MMSDNPLALLVGCAAVGGAAISVHTHIKCNEIDGRQKTDIQTIYTQFSNLARDLTLRIERLEAELKKNSKELNKINKKDKSSIVEDDRQLISLISEESDSEDQEEEDETDIAIKALTRNSKYRN